MVGKVYESEKFSFTDDQSGAQITQYTRNGNTNRTLYFTNRPYTGDGEHVVFLSDRTGRREMFMVHLRTGQIVQLTDCGLKANVSNCIHPTHPQVYFHDSQVLSRVHTDTMKTEELLRVPDGFGFGILNLNAPPWLAFEVLEVVPQGMKRLKSQAQDGPVPPTGLERFFMRRLALIYRYNVETDELECLWSENRMLTHVQLSPTDPNLLIFSDWAGYGSDRVYYMNLAKKVKSPPRPLLPESARSRGGHESFTRKGNVYCQWMEGDLEREGNHTLSHAVKYCGGVPTAQVEGARFEQYLLPERCKDLMHHYTLSSDERWGVHDRWRNARTIEEGNAYLSVFRHQLDFPQTISRKIAFTNANQGDGINLGPELTIDNNDETALYTSFLTGTKAEPKANLCQIDLRPFVDELMKDVK